MSAKNSRNSKTIKAGKLSVKVGYSNSINNKFIIHVQHDEINPCCMPLIYYKDEFLELILKEMRAQTENKHPPLTIPYIVKAITKSFDIYPNPKAKNPMNSKKCGEVIRKLLKQKSSE